MAYDYDVCLSFAGEDREYVDAVAAELRANSLRVFYDRYEEVNLWGKDLYQHLDEVYRERAAYCVVFVSEAYAGKLWTKHELKSAQARAFAENQEYILPARFDDTELPGMRSTTGYIDLRAKSPRDFATLIIKKVRGDSSGPIAAPQPPKPQVSTRSTSALPAVKGLSASDVLILGLFGDAALAEDSTTAISTEEIWRAAEAAGIERSDFEDSLEILASTYHLEPSRVLAEIPPHYSLTLQGFDTYLHEFTPNFIATFRSIASAIVHDGLREKEDIINAVAQPTVIVDHVLDMMRDKQYVKLERFIGGYATITDVGAALRRLVKSGA